MVLFRGFVYAYSSGFLIMITDGRDLEITQLNNKFIGINGVFFTNTCGPYILSDFRST